MSNQEVVDFVRKRIADHMKPQLVRITSWKGLPNSHIALASGLPLVILCNRNLGSLPLQHKHIKLLLWGVLELFGMVMTC